MISGKIYGPFKVPPAEQRTNPFCVLKVDYEIKLKAKPNNVGGRLDALLSLDPWPILIKPDRVEADYFGNGIGEKDFNSGAKMLNPCEIARSTTTFVVTKDFKGTDLRGWQLVIGSHIEGIFCRFP